MEDFVKQDVKRIGTTYQKLADFIGVNRSHLYRVISGQSPLTPEIACKLDEIFETEVYSEIYIIRERNRIYDLKKGGEV